MKRHRTFAAPVLAMLLAAPGGPAQAANHREAPITALDRASDITDWYTFVSYDKPNKVTLILAVDPLLEPSNGPNYFPFDPNVLYTFHVDNDQDGVANDVRFEVRFQTEIRLPDVFTTAVGGIAGIPPITKLNGPGSEGLGLRQSYTVDLDRNGHRTELSYGPEAVRRALQRRAAHHARLRRARRALRAGDLQPPPRGEGLRRHHGRRLLHRPRRRLRLPELPHGRGGRRLEPCPGRRRQHELRSRRRLRVQREHHRPRGADHAPDQRRATAPVDRPQGGARDVRHARRGRASRCAARPPDDDPLDNFTFRRLRQVQRMGNPLINELIIGTGSKDRFSMDDPENDSQFANFFLHPLLATVFGTLGIPVPTGDRTDLLPLVTYTGPIVPPGTPAGAIADLLRINTGIPPTPLANQKRLGLLTLLDGDPGNDDRRGVPQRPSPGRRRDRHLGARGGGHPRRPGRVRHAHRRRRQQGRHAQARDVPLRQSVPRRPQQPPRGSG